jgi:hypothetical protein
MTYPSIKSRFPEGDLQVAGILPEMLPPLYPYSAIQLTKWFAAQYEIEVTVEWPTDISKEGVL